MKFIGEGANALLIGKPGTGKSHVAKAVAYQATLQGHDVRYVEADTEFARFALCTAQEQAALLRAYIEPDLLVLDDLFLARRIPDASAELLQTIVHRRYKRRASIVITSNRIVAVWGKYLRDATMGTTILEPRGEVPERDFPACLTCMSRPDLVASRDPHCLSSLPPCSARSSVTLAIAPHRLDAPLQEGSDGHADSVLVGHAVRHDSTPGLDRPARWQGQTRRRGAGAVRHDE